MVTDTTMQSAPRAAIGTGTLLDGRYLLGQQIGRGAMGVIYEATHVLLARKVAVKLIGGDAELSTAAQHRFSKEGQNLAAVVHPHVVTVFDFGFCNGAPYLVMEYLAGESLDARVRRAGRMEVDVAFSVARQVLRGLAAAHGRGIIHRDIKPANIVLLDSSDGWPHAKLIDFGLSTHEGKTDSKPRVAGTPSYLPPEQARGEAVDARADIYSLGATIYEALTGRPPLVAKNLPTLLAAIQWDAPVPPSTLRRDLPREVDRLLLRALAKKREERFASAEEMLAAFEELRTGPAQSRRRYVLVVDPDPESGAACGRAALSMGRVALAVRDGLEALEAVRVRGLPELVLANLSLPRLDGMSLLAELRRDPKAEGLPAIVASRTPSLRQSAQAAAGALGVAALLPELSDEAEVTRAMRAVLIGERSAEPEPTTELRRTESRRLEKIRRLRLGDDAPPEEALQRFVLEVAKAFRVPVALVSIILEERQWYHAYTGVEGKFLAERGTPRELAFCNHVVEGGERLLVPDATVHPVFKEHPLVKDGSVGGYAGSPLVTPTGEVLGTLCLVDKSPLSLSAEMVDALDALARRVAGELEVFGQTMEDLGGSAPPPSLGRRPSTVPPDSPSGYPPSSTFDEQSGATLDLEQAMRDSGCAAVLFDSARRIVRASPGLMRMFGIAPEHALGLTRDELIHRLSCNFADPAGFLHAVRVLPEGPFAARAALHLGGRGGDHRARPALWFARPVPGPGGGVQQLEVFREMPRPQDG